ncbi:DNA-binding response regulator [Gammaproteobacteria bacterium 42_54_T18]|nr:DNA-binding response regulator [Gammaproteobacteria bacterium 42_54_T18]
MRIGYLEDDVQQASTLKQWMIEQGYQCVHFERAFELIQGVRKGQFDLLVLDWELPDISGIDTLVTIRTQINENIPVLFCTQRDAEDDIIMALEKGADDYVVKPVRKGELSARLSALARRAGVGAAVTDVIVQAPYRLDLKSKKAFNQEVPITLTEKDFDLAACLFSNCGRVLSRTYLLETVWGLSADINTRTVDVHISRIRKAFAIGAEAGYRIKTVYQHGYRLERIEPED